MSHDYDPAWDYPVVELSQLSELDDADRAGIDWVQARVRAEQLAEALGFAEGFEIHFVEPLGLTSFQDGTAVFGVYCNGTSSRPVVCIDPTLLKQACVDASLSPRGNNFKPIESDADKQDVLIDRCRNTVTKCCVTPRVG